MYFSGGVLAFDTGKVLIRNFRESGPRKKYINVCFTPGTRGTFG